MQGEESTKYINNKYSTVVTDSPGKKTIGLYRDVWIAAIASSMQDEVGDSNGGNV